MKLTVTILGLSVLAVELERAPQWVIEDAEEEPPQGITGGSAMGFERDLYPPDPSGEEPWVDRGFGFRL